MQTGNQPAKPGTGDGVSTEQAADPVSAWINARIGKLDLAGVRPDEAFMLRERARAALERRRDAIAEALRTYRRVEVVIELGDDDPPVVLVAKKPNGAVAHRRFVDEMKARDGSLSASTLAYALEFVVYPEWSAAQRLFDEWPGIPDNVADVANTLCGVKARHLGK